MTLAIVGKEPLDELKLGWQRVGYDGDDGWLDEFLAASQQGLVLMTLDDVDVGFFGLPILKI